eukprot:SRR837773.19091.p1 GENE.SRR837773.19091~~SRR837773.19091.p1  ORF type:complete len:752 (-),score=253.31 SRR837773.19091:48-2186(-)
MESSQVAKLWADRGGTAQVVRVWSVHNPLLAYRYRQRRAVLEAELRRPAAELRGFHGSAPGNILSIAEKGFDAGRRCGQVYGAGEYFAKNPSVSVGYCRGGSFMLVCQLTLGVESKERDNSDGDHIWVNSAKYYVISGPAQALPLYIVQFDQGHRRGTPLEADLELARALAPGELRVGAKDERQLTLTATGGPSDLSVEVLPAVWWNGDADAFLGRLSFDQASDAAELPEGEGCSGAVVLVRRGCGKFAAAAATAQRRGARALLVLQSEYAAPSLVMQGVEGVDCTLAAAMISKAQGEALLALARGGGAAVALAQRAGGEQGVPPNRPCAMSADFTDALWLGYLHSHFSDRQLTSDLERFFEEHAPGASASIRIVRGKFTQAKVALKAPLSRAQVQALNERTFLECGRARTLTVDDAHGSSGQRCPRSISGYCRGHNLRFIDPCWCEHGKLPTEGARFQRELLDPEGAKADEISSLFMSSRCFHNGTPTVVEVHAIVNPALRRQHELYRRYLTQKHGKAPKQVELYHGTNVNILDTVYTHGLFPPSDVQASDDCPVSGGKGLRTSLCDNRCKHCTEPHRWDRCHMFGLGIYLGDLAAKSHRYVSGVAPGGDHKMLVCSVLLGEALQIEGHLKCGDAMHNLQSLRGLTDQDVPKMVDSLGTCAPCAQVDTKDILFVKGLGSQCRPGFSVYNSEYIAFHPYQCLPLYEITYRMG